MLALTSKTLGYQKWSDLLGCDCSVSLQSTEKCLSPRGQQQRYHFNLVILNMFCTPTPPRSLVSSSGQTILVPDTRQNLSQHQTFQELASRKGWVLGPHRVLLEYACLQGCLQVPKTHPHFALLSFPLLWPVVCQEHPSLSTLRLGPLTGISPLFLMLRPIKDIRHTASFVCLW